MDCLKNIAIYFLIRMSSWIRTNDTRFTTDTTLSSPRSTTCAGVLSVPRQRGRRNESSILGWEWEWYWWYIQRNRNTHEWNCLFLNWCLWRARCWWDVKKSRGNEKRARRWTDEEAREEARIKESCPTKNGGNEIVDGIRPGTSN